MTKPCVSLICTETLRLFISHFYQCRLITKTGTRGQHHYAYAYKIAFIIKCCYWCCWTSYLCTYPLTLWRGLLLSVCLSLLSQRLMITCILLCILCEHMYINNLIKKIDLEINSYWLCWTLIYQGALEVKLLAKLTTDWRKLFLTYKLSKNNAKLGIMQHALCSTGCSLNIVFFSKNLKYIPDSDLYPFPALCTQTTKRQVEHQRCSRTGRVQKDHNILRKKHNI